MANRQRKTLHVGQVLSARGSPLARMAKRAVRQEAVNRRLRQVLGPPLCNHVALGAVEPGRLVVVTDSPVWSSRIRYQANHLLASLAEYIGSHPSPRLEIRIAPVSGMEPRRSRTHARLSKAGAAHLREYVESGAADPDQADALMRIAASATAAE